MTTLRPSSQSEFVKQALEDGEVSASELALGYERMISCFAAHGGHGEYAFDLSVGPGISLNWTVKGDDADGTKTDAVDHLCRGQYVGTLEMTDRRPAP